MSLTNAAETRPPEARVHPVDEVLPAPRLLILGLQQLFIMYAGAVAVPLIVGGALGLPTSTIGLLVTADLFVSGIATVVQSVGIGKIFGVRMPVVAGATFTVLTPMIVIAQKYGLPAVYGAMLISGVFGLLIAKPFSMVIVVFTLNLVFNHWTRRPKGESAVSAGGRSAGAFRGDGRRRLEGCVLERGHDARRGIVGHPGLRA
jgi:xanthine/uracil permease